MTAIATLLVVALIGFVVTILFIIAGALGFRKIPIRVNSMIEPTKNSAVELYNTGKGVVAVGKIRYDGYVKQGTRIYNSVKTSADEVGTAAKSVDVGGAADALKTAAASINAAQEGLAAAKAIVDILGRASNKE